MAIQGTGVTPPQEQCPFQDKFLATPMSVLAQNIGLSAIGWMWPAADRQTAMRHELCSQSHLQLQSARSCDAAAQRQPPLAARTGANLVQTVFDGE